MMMEGRNKIADGVTEFKVALSTAQAGTLKAACILVSHHEESCMSPNTRFLQIRESGKEITKPHHGTFTNIMKKDELVFVG